MILLSCRRPIIILDSLPAPMKYLAQTITIQPGKYDELGFAIPPVGAVVGTVGRLLIITALPVLIFFFIVKWVDKQDVRKPSKK